MVDLAAPDGVSGDFASEEADAGGEGDTYVGGSVWGGGDEGDLVVEGVGPEVEGAVEGAFGLGSEVGGDGGGVEADGDGFAEEHEVGVGEGFVEIALVEGAFGGVDELVDFWLDEGVCAGV